MAGNFWQSSHFQQWVLDKQDLIRERNHDLSILSDEEYQKIFIFFSNFIQILGEQLKLRQQVIATATVYFKRFYARNSLKCIDPLLLAPTCVFLASKVEEFGVISNSRLITTCQTVGFCGPSQYYILTLHTASNYYLNNVVQIFWRLSEQPLRMAHHSTAEIFGQHYLDNSLTRCEPEELEYSKDLIVYSRKCRSAPRAFDKQKSCYNNPQLKKVKNKFNYAYTQEFPYRTNHILECEFYLLENLDCCLIVYQPYRPLLQLIQDIGHEEQLLALAWRVVNDSLRTDVCLLYPPYQIAIGCLQIACVILQKDLKSWFAELNVDIEKIQEIAKYVISLFELWKTYDEKKDIQALLAKMPKPKTQQSR